MMIEIIIVVSIILVSVLAVMSVAQKAVSVSRQSLHISQSALLLEEGAEIVRILRDNSWNNISSLDPATTYYASYSSGWTLSNTPSTIGIFTRTVSIANVKRDAVTGNISPTGTDDPDTKFFTINVIWNEGGTTITKSLPFYITNIF